MINSSYIKNHVVSVSTPKSFSDLLVLADKVKPFETVFTTDGNYKIERNLIAFTGNFGTRKKSFSVSLLPFNKVFGTPIFEVYKDITVEEAFRRPQVLKIDNIVSYAFVDDKGSDHFSPFFLLKCPRFTEELDAMYEEDKKLNASQFLSFVATFYDRIVCVNASNGKHLSSPLVGLVNTPELGLARTFKDAWVDRLSPDSKLFPNSISIYVSGYLYVLP